MADNKVKQASVLAFERKLSTSDGLMFSGQWQDRDQEKEWKSVPVSEKAVRGTISNRLKGAIARDDAKLNKEVQKPNLQCVDVAALPFEADTLKLEFTLRVLGQLHKPSACNEPDYQDALEKMILGYVKDTQFEELALRYATNLANGRFLWRNRMDAEEIEIRVHQLKQQQVVQTWIFDGYEYSLRDFDHRPEALTQLAREIQNGLSGETFTLFRVEAFVRLGEGQEVFPSQELVLSESNKKENNKSKILYQVQDVAALHSQKVGNALRTIDTWYPEAEDLGPISVEPYGSVTNRGKAYRTPVKKCDLYTLLDNWLLKNKVPEQEQQHFVMANLIRGGVFGGND